MSELDDLESGIYSQNGGKVCVFDGVVESAHRHPYSTTRGMIGILALTVLGSATGEPRLQLSVCMAWMG